MAEVERKSELILDEVDWYNSGFERTLESNASLTQSTKEVYYQLYRLREVAQESAANNRANMANVIASMVHSESPIVYLVAGHPGVVRFYVGVASKNKRKAEDDLEQLRASMEGNLLGSVLEPRPDTDELEHHFKSLDRLGLLTGVPTIDEQSVHSSEADFQGVERLANAMMGERWLLAIVAHPSSKEELKERTRSIYDLITEISSQLKVSYQVNSTQSFQTSDTEGKSNNKQISESETQAKNTTESGSKSELSGSNKTNTHTQQVTNSKTTTTGQDESIGTNQSRSKSQTNSFGESETRERTDRRMEEWYEHLSENLLERFRLGFSQGMFGTSIYFSANGSAAYDRLSANLVSLFQGDQKTMTPLRPYPLKRSRLSGIGDLFKRPRLSRKLTSDRLLIAHSIPVISNQQFAVSTWLNSQEISLLTAPSSSELPGLQVRPTVDFGLNVPSPPTSQSIVHLGHLLQHGRPLNSMVALTPRTLNSHTFVAGVTGSGKTTTCMKLLNESGLNFMVIEPAKTEYRALLRYQEAGEELEYYTLNREDLSTFRINPFELVSMDEPLVSHIDIIKATLLAVFPMEAAMPYMVEEAIVKAYETKGWDIYSTANMYWSDPWSPDADAWPNFSDVISELEGVIKSKGLGKEFEEKYLGSLVARLSNLTLGTKGRMLNARRSIDFDRLLDSKVVIELDEVKDEEDKALIMGLILTRVAECAKHRFRRDPSFQYLVLVEEAHRLLSKPEPGDPGSKKMGVSMFSNMLAEVRKYGMGLVIADQIPSKLVPDVIKNTNTKIIHRLFAADDRSMIGDAMCLSEEQRDFLPRLKPGEVIVYQGGWHAPVWVQVPLDFDTGLEEVPVSEIRRCGQLQLWRDRGRVLPNFAQSESLESPELFCDVHERGVRLISSLERIVPDIMRDKGRQKKSTRLALAAIHTDLEECDGRLQNDKEPLEVALARIVIDYKNIDTGYFLGVARIIAIFKEFDDPDCIHSWINESTHAMNAATSVFK